MGNQGSAWPRAGESFKFQLSSYKKSMREPGSKNWTQINTDYQDLKNDPVNPQAPEEREAIARCVSPGIDGDKDQQAPQGRHISTRRCLAKRSGHKKIGAPVWNADLK
jgi:hypothetical protein